MSLLSIIENNNEFRTWLKSHVPQKSDFQSFSENPPFDKKRTPSLITVSTEASDSSITGTAADYLFRFMIASYVNEGKEDAVADLQALKGLKAIRKKYYQIHNISDYGELSIKNQKVKIRINRLLLRYEDSITAIKSYIQNESNDIRTIANICVWFAYLEQYIRSNRVPEAYNAVIRYDKSDHEKQIEKVLNYASIFNAHFIQQGFVRRNSTVIYNPDFGEYSLKVGGADGDIFIDGVLYDFKAVADNGYRFRNIAQIFSYYLLYVLDCRHNHTSKLANYEVTKLALYYANYGQIYYVECSELTNNIDVMIQEFEEIVEDVNRSILFDRMLGERLLGDVQSYFPEFSDKMLDTSVFGASDVDEYLSLACPVYTTMPDNICDLAPVPWTDNQIPKAALDSGVYFVNIECHFSIKEGKTPFIVNKKGSKFPRNIPLTTSIIDSTGKLCGYYTDSDGMVKLSCPDLYLYSNDFKLFLETYDVKDLRIKSGIYFVSKEQTRIIE